MKVELKQLDVNMAEQEYEMLQGILDLENGFANPAYNLSYKEYKNWLEWYNDTLNADGTFANTNEFNSQMFPTIISKLGWSGGTKTAISYLKLKMRSYSFYIITLII